MGAKHDVRTDVLSCYAKYGALDSSIKGQMKQYRAVGMHDLSRHMKHDAGSLIEKVKELEARRNGSILDLTTKGKVPKHPKHGQESLRHSESWVIPFPWNFAGIFVGKDSFASAQALSIESEMVHIRRNVLVEFEEFRSGAAIPPLFQKYQQFWEELHPDEVFDISKERDQIIAQLKRPLVFQEYNYRSGKRTELTREDVETRLDSAGFSIALMNSDDTLWGVLTEAGYIPTEDERLLKAWLEGSVEKGMELDGVELGSRPDIAKSLLQELITHSKITTQLSINGNQRNIYSFDLVVAEQKDSNLIRLKNEFAVYIAETRYPGLNEICDVTKMANLGRQLLQNTVQRPFAMYSIKWVSLTLSQLLQSDELIKWYKQHKPTELTELFNKKKSDGSTILHETAQLGLTEKCKQLIELGVKID